ncbi:MAG: Rrf2 family transcriptional regulator [Bacteroidales bacterium]|nr:Rrf2 family transcriptional regulator [Bacteroidales bacterium]
MKLNTKVRYGLRAMVDIAANQEQGGVLQKTISTRQQISVKYLDVIISSLKRQGLIINTAGKKSGYKLTRPAEEISAYDIYRAFEPELLLVNCIYNKIICERSDTCVAHDYWSELNQHLKTLMENTSLKQVMSGTFNF